jgi:catechol 2,3-dioxygenase-like lactoylglutathione lyase family enzyme
MKMARLIPMLPVRSMPASVEFYQKLGFSIEHRNDDWGWAMLRFDECRLMVDQSISQQVCMLGSAEPGSAAYELGRRTRRPAPQVAPGLAT